MVEAKDTLHRQLSLFRLTTEYPRYTSSQTLRDKLYERGLKVDLRTVQRNLNRPSIPFSLISQDIGGRNGWSHTEGALLDIHVTKPATALALHLGLNDNIQVHEPTVWQTQIRAKLELMRRRYEATAPTLEATP
tara:strand:+ start:446 stop:847 length:402 start_codon:yes stop_codon:yes gene_type:complete